MKHTQGKWEVINPHYQKAYSIRGDGIRIADNILSPADARLIATAPDLLVACKMILESEQYSGSNAVAEVTIYSLNKARKAITKAEEKQ